MGNDKKTPVTINDKQYNFEDLTEQQQIIFNHIIDLNRKIASAQFNLDQLSVGRTAFMSMLTEAIAQAEAQVEAPAEATVQ